MKRLISLITLSILCLSVLSSCMKPPEEADGQAQGKLALERLKAIASAPELYVGMSETYYIDNNLSTSIEVAGYHKSNLNAMWYYEDIEDEKYNESFIKTVGKKETSSGDFDFKEAYGENYSQKYIGDIINSYISLLDSTQFEITPNDKGFSMICTDQALINKYNSYIYTEDEDGNTMAALLGDNLKMSFTIDFENNDMDALDIISTTNIEGENHTLTIKKIIQFIADENGLKNIRSEIDNYKS